MSDYEVLDLFYVIIEALQASVMNYVAVLFAFLIASYLIADKLESSMVFVVVGLFTVVVFQQASPIIGFGNDMAGIGNLIGMRAAVDSSTLSWHGAAQPWGSAAIYTLQYAAIAVLFCSYIGALVFFFHQRHVGRAR